MQYLNARFKELSTTGKIIVITTPIVFLLLIILIILLYVTSLRSLPSNMISVTDYDSLSINVPESNRKDLSEQIYYLLSEHFDPPEEPVTAIIRPETLINNSEYNTTNISFIIDIDEYKQSYRAYLTWSNTGEWLPQTTSVECVENSLSKYPDVLCYGMYFNSDDIDLYLPYTSTIADGTEYTIKKRYYPDNTPYLEIAIDSCGNQTILDQALNSAKAWLTANHFNIESYFLEVPTHYCADGSL